MPKRLPVVLSRQEVDEVLGHSNVSTTQIYTRVLNKGPLSVVSPAPSAAAP